MTNQTIERTTLTQLLNNEDYARKVLPFIKENYFDVREERIIFQEISKFTDKYKKIPTQTSLEIEVGERKDLTDIEHDKIVQIIQSLNPAQVDFDWLVDTTEKFCKDKAIYNAIVEGISIIDGKIKNELLMHFQIYFQMPWVFLLTIVSVMIIFWIQTTGILTIIK